jgi:phosphoesterase RecJ-like protein
MQILCVKRSKLPDKKPETADLMLKPFFDFIEKNDSFILTTHDPPDADGLGSEMVCAFILKSQGKNCRIINASPTPEHFLFMDPGCIVEYWKDLDESGKFGDFPEKSSLIILDTSDEYNIGAVKELLGRVRDVMVIDHHQPGTVFSLSGIVDSGAASTCEIAVEAAKEAGLKPDVKTAMAAFAGIVYDTGSFAYSKTTLRTFKAALWLLECGVVPYEVHRNLNENASRNALLLQKRVLSSLDICCKGRVAVQVLRKEDLETTGTKLEDAESFINVPLKAREIEVSLMIKETLEGKIRCSLRSKGTVNVSKIAQQFGGGGHVTAAGFRSGLGIEKTLDQALKKIESLLDMV